MKKLLTPILLALAFIMSANLVHARISLGLNSSEIQDNIKRNSGITYAKLTIYSPMFGKTLKSVDLLTHNLIAIDLPNEKHNSVIVRLDIRHKNKGRLFKNFYFGDKTWGGGHNSTMQSASGAGLKVTIRDHDSPEQKIHALNLISVQRM